MLPEADVTFHRGTGLDEGTTFVTVVWDVPASIGFAHKAGFKFLVSSEIMDRFMLLGKQEDDEPTHMDTCGTKYRGCDPECTYQERVKTDA